MRVPMVYPVVSADDLTQRKRSKWIVRTGWSASQPNHAFGEYAYRTLKVRRVATIALDYAFGWESVGGFQRTFEAEGGKVTQKIWAPVSVHDFAPYLAQVSRDVDAVYALVLGRAALQFMRQYREFGLKDRILLIGGGTTTDEHVLPFMGDEAIGDVSALHYSAALDTPKNIEFVKAYRAKFGKVPSYYSENNYTTAQWLDEALKKAGGKWPGPEELIKIMVGIKLDAVRGPVSFDDMRNPIQNIYIKKVEKKKMFGYEKDELWNTVTKTYPNVSQFWTYGKDKFLAQPVYDKNFPPCKFCE